MFFNFPVFYLSLNKGGGGEGLELRNLEAYPKNLKTWENSSYKNDFIPNNLYSQSKDKAYTPCLRKCVKTSPPPPYLFKTNFVAGEKK